MMGGCKYCGNETNPKKYWGDKMYKYTGDFCSMGCRANYEDMQNKNSKMNKFLGRLRVKAGVDE